MEPIDAPSELETLLEELHREIDEIAGRTSRDANASQYPDPTSYSPVQRRVLIRSIFSLVEGVAFGLKSFALEDRRAGELPPSELQFAREIDYDLTDAGDIVERPAKLRTLGNLRFAFKLFARIHGSSFALDVSGPGWQSLHSTARVRDRLMHPRGLVDLSVTDDEIRTAFVALVWLDAQVVLLLVATVRAMRGQHEDLRRELGALLQKPRPTTG